MIHRQTSALEKFAEKSEGKKKVYKGSMPLEYRIVSIFVNCSLYFMVMDKLTSQANTLCVVWLRSGLIDF